MKPMPREKAFSLYYRILEVKVDNIQPRSNKRLFLDEFAVEVRKFLKEVGFTNRQISVRVPTYSMVQAIEITVPVVESPYTHNKNEWDALSDSSKNLVRADYEVNQDYRAAAQQHLQKVILAAFPQNGDRSDMQSDYFDYTFSVWGS